MKFIFSGLIFIVILIPILVLNFILWNENTFLVLGSLSTLAWFFTYLYIDKILLAFIGAREVIGTDENMLFQVLKNQAYTNSTQLPRVYVYDGNSENCFLFQSLRNWTIVLDKNLLEGLDQEATEGLVEFFYLYHKTVRRAYIKTKALGICVLFYALIYKIFTNLFVGKTNNRVFKAIMSFFIVMFRPFILPFETILRSKKRLNADHSLKKFSLNARSDFNFEVFLTELVLKNTSIGKLITQYIESYPLLSECEYQYEY